MSDIQISRPVRRSVCFPRTHICCEKCPFRDCVVFRMSTTLVRTRRQRRVRWLKLKSANGVREAVSLFSVLQFVMKGCWMNPPEGFSKITNLSWKETTLIQYDSTITSKNNTTDMSTVPRIALSSGVQSFSLLSQRSGLGSETGPI